MPFSKLDSGITKSSIWSEKLHVRVVWVSLLAEKDADGFVQGARSGLIRTCNVTPEQYDDALDVLTSPDPDSQNPDNNGRRIDVIPGGIVVLNHAEYRLPEDEKRAKTRERVRKHRVKKQQLTDDVTRGNAVKRKGPLPSVSVSASVSDSVSASKRGSAKGRFKPPSLEAVKAYCAERKNSVDPEQWMSHYESNGWMVGRNKMKDWQAAVRTWEKNTKAFSSTQRKFGRQEVSNDELKRQMKRDVEVHGEG